MGEVLLLLDALCSFVDRSGAQLCLKYCTSFNIKIEYICDQIYLKLTMHSYLVKKYGSSKQSHLL